MVADLVEREASETFDREPFPATTSPCPLPCPLTGPWQRADEALGAFSQPLRNRLPVLLVVALVDGGSLVVPPTEFRSFLLKGQCHPVREQGEDIPYMRPVLEGGPHVGSRSASHLVTLVELNEENGPSISFLRDRSSQLVLRYGASLQPALVAVLIGNHLEPVALV